MRMEVLFLFTPILSISITSYLLEFKHFELN